jgi:predicted tellurium resistance membrane protein TerC
VVGIFLIVFVSVTMYAGYLTGFRIFTEPLYWVMIVIFAVACAVILLIHEWSLKRKQ